MITKFQKDEERNGLRWTWNHLPANRQDATRMIIPIACLCTPLKPIPNIPVVNYNPQMCPRCRSILNPFCRIDYSGNTWTCCFCLRNNDLPRSYHGISPQRTVAELHQNHTTIEYVVGKKVEEPPFYLYVVDTCLSREQLKELKETILMSLDLLPENASVGLITFGATVQLFELGYQELSKAYVFRGDKSPTLAQFQEQIGLVSTFEQPENWRNYIKKKFVVPLQDFEMNITEIIEEISPDPWPVKHNCRSRRCTGVALSVATSLLQSGFMNVGGHVLTFIGGPCTMGDGRIVGEDRKEIIRLHSDIQNDNAAYFKKSVRFYHNLAERLVKNSHVCHLFAANLDQVGLMEMKSVCEETGGVLIMSDSFHNPTFSVSFKRFLDENISISLNGTLEIQTSRNVKICGALGPLASMNRKTHCVSDTEIGYGNTNAWKLNCLGSGTTIAFFFDVSKTQGGMGGMSVDPKRYFQFVTSYRHHTGEFRYRVTTTDMDSAPPGHFDKLAAGFDQECSSVIMSRLAVFRAQSEYLFDVLRWLDRSLIRLVRRFGNYQKDDPMSLQLPSHFGLFPQFMYHLRRGHFLRIFNNSPDETCFYRFYLNRETCNNSIKMIQPVVLLYTFNEKPKPVNLDSRSLKKDAILLLDCFDTVLIYHGKQIADWIESGYHKQPKYESFRQLMIYPESDAKSLLESRFPYPRMIKCDEGSSQARIIYSKVNPSSTHNSPMMGSQGEEFKILTDDSSLQFFMKHLKELVVASEKYG